MRGRVPLLRSPLRETRVAENKVPSYNETGPFLGPAVFPQQHPTRLRQYTG